MLIRTLPDGMDAVIQLQPGPAPTGAAGLKASHLLGHCVRCANLSATLREWILALATALEKCTCNKNVCAYFIHSLAKDKQLLVKN